MNYVIIGNGPAGISAAKAIRSIDISGRITILTSEKFYTYSRIPLPDYIAGTMNEDRLVICNGDFYRILNIELKLDVRVVGVSLSEKLVNVDVGEPIPYDRLLIATGSRPIIPTIDGIDKKGVYGIRTLKDCRKIIQHIKEIRDAVVLGAGRIGLKAIKMCHQLGLNVTVVEKEPRILPAIIDNEISSSLVAILEKKGVNVMLNSTLDAVKGNSSVESVIVSGREIKTKLLLVCTGVIPNIEFLNGSGIRIEKGIFVDEYMQTNITDVFSAGDVAVVPDVTSKSHQHIPIWPEAINQGRIAGNNMAGIKKSFEGGLMMNSTQVFSIPIISMGDVGGTHAVYGWSNSEYAEWRKIYLNNGKIAGAILVGNIKPAGIIRAILKKGEDISKSMDAILSPNFNYAMAMS